MLTPAKLDLSSIALPVLEAAVAAAAACQEWVGRGDKHAADHAAVEAMREALGRVPGSGVVVIGEGEKDAAPMLFAGEKVGAGGGPSFDVAVDPLEGTTLCATGVPGAVTVVAASPPGTMRPLAGFYMDKIVVGSHARGCIDIDAPIEENLRTVAVSAGAAVGRLRVAVLRKPRHAELIARIRAAGASVVEIPDGDVMAGLSALVPGSGVDLAVGVGGSPEGVLTACAARLLGGDMQARPAPQTDGERDRLRDAGQLGDRYEAADLVAADDGVFAASAVTGCELLRGPRSGPEGLVVHSILVRRGDALRIRSAA